MTIENPASYERGKMASIYANASKTRRSKYVARWGEKEVRAVEDHCYRYRDAENNNFFDSMVVAINEWGALTDGQHMAVVRIMADMLEKDHELALKMNANKVEGEYVGIEGKRDEFEGTITFTTNYETQYGLTLVVGMTDVGGNQIILKGASGDLWEIYDNEEKGNRIRVKGTPSHQEYNGQKQTVLKRVAII